MSAFCLANVFHCISRPNSGFAYAAPLFASLKMAFWSRFIGELSSCWTSTSAVFRNTVLESDSLCEQESPTAMELQGNDENSGNER